jgi:hypothetical protein
MRVPRVDGIITIEQILRWADDHHRRTGMWPISRSGLAAGARGRTWEGIDTSLRKGGNGMPGGSSLSRLLAKERDVGDPRRALPNLTMEQVLQWADEHHRRTGRWPGRESGRVRGGPDVTWNTVDRRLRSGSSRMQRGGSLAGLIREHRGVWDSRGNHPLSPELVLQWADEHKKRTGRWPVTLSGPIIGHAPETWAAVDVGMRNRRRGYHGPHSLSRLLAIHRNYTPNYQPKAGERLGPPAKTRRKASAAPAVRPASRAPASRKRPTRKPTAAVKIDWRSIQKLLKGTRR